jgi:hypothetical protein
LLTISKGCVKQIEGPEPRRTLVDLLLEGSTRLLVGALYSPSPDILGFFPITLCRVAVMR